MSLHSSLKRAEKLAGTRSVMKRSERIKWLAKKGQWKEGDRILGLPKIKVIKLKTAKKEKVKDAEGATPGAAASATPGAAAATPKAATKQEGKKA